MDVNELRDANPVTIAAAATTFRTLRDTFSTAASDLETEGRDLVEVSWFGSASMAAAQRIGHAYEALTAIRDRMGSAATAVDDFAAAVTSCQQTLADADTLASTYRLRIGADGTIYPPADQVFADEAEIEAIENAMLTASQYVTGALTVATDADNACARNLAAEVLAIVQGDWLGSNGLRDSRSYIWLSNLSTGSSVLGAVNQFLPGGVLQPPVPGLQPFGIVDSTMNAVSSGGDVWDQIRAGDPYGQHGAAFVGDVAETGFNASMVAFAVAPHPVTAIAVLATGATWGVAANWNHIPFHDDIEDAAGWVNEHATEGFAHVVAHGDAAWDEGWETAGDLWDSGENLVGGLGDMVGL